MCQHPGLDFMAGHGVTTRMQTPSLTPLLNYWLPTELAGAPPGVNQCARTIGSRTQEILEGGDSYSEGPETPDINRGVTDFASLSPSVNIHRPAEQAFAVEEDEDSDEMFAMMDRLQWTGQGVSEPAITPSLSQMFALAKRMGYEMRPIARRANQPPGSPRTPFASRQGYCPPFRQGHDFARIKCFSCSQMGHTQARCPKPDPTLPFKPPGWN